ncbi:MAG: DUF480 domain-containing protein [Betaproteobacteria bacterium]|nr:DUF480 domain-containing protein [Betaproteobacteria bacterium]
MVMQLSPDETRVIGCLIEKEITTPEQYPLSLNALTNACNQKSNRDPVLELSEAAVLGTVERLIAKFVVSEHSGYGARVRKFQHRFCNTSFGNLKFSPQELAIICELFLRGPQTPGELRSRAGRLCPFGDVTEVEGVLRSLTVREDGPFVVRLAREPGKRESRYAHTFGDAVAGVEEGGSHEVAADHVEKADVRSEPVSRLEQRVAALEADVAELKKLLNDRSVP